MFCSSFLCLFCSLVYLFKHTSYSSCDARLVILFNQATTVTQTESRRYHNDIVKINITKIKWIVGYFVLSSFFRFQQCLDLMVAVFSHKSPNNL